MYLKSTCFSSFVLFNLFIIVLSRLATLQKNKKTLDGFSKPKTRLGTTQVHEML
jgi:hypothetical protein